MARQRKLSFTTRYVIMIGLILLTANLVLGIISLNRSKSDMRVLIDKNMLDVVNTAAGLIDGDALGALTESDVGSESYNEIYEKLAVFQNKVDIEYIYAVRQVDDGKFVFTVDPDPVAPGAFGEEIVVSQGLIAAGNGTPSVDDAPLEDQWGDFYSAYSPVFDSSGNVAGVIGIDFDAQWYDRQVRDHTLSISVVSVLSFLIGGVLIFLITRRVSVRFKELDAEISGLSNSVDRLMEEVVSMSGRVSPPREQPEQPVDELEALGAKIHNMQSDMGLYLEYLRTQAYIDALTKVKSASAYHEMLESLGGEIAKGNAAFSVAVFDINNLKEINDSFGHEYGDMIIKGAADAIARVFGTEETYRIGGDEFVVVSQGERADEMERKLALVDETVAAFNAKDGIPAGVALNISSGMTSYQPGKDTGYREVFARADRTMYEHKKAYYQTVGDRRRG